MYCLGLELNLDDGVENKAEVLHVSCQISMREWLLLLSHARDASEVAQKFNV